MVTCPNCRQQNDETDVTCRACGYQLIGGPAPSPVPRRFPLKMIIGIVGCIALFLYIAYRVASALNALP